VGTIEGHDWIVTEEVRGQNLQEAWPGLTLAERRRAIRQLWERVQIVHDATPSLRPLVGSHSGFIPATSDEATTAAARAGAAVGLSDVQRSRFHQIVEGYYRAAPFVEQVVAHGDLALVNALWDDGEVVALLDFEFAMLSAAEIDLCRLVWDGLVSEDGTTIDPEASAAAFDIAARQLDPVHGRALLHGAAVLDQLRDLDIWLARGRTEERFEDWRPYRLLTGLLDPEGGYLAAQVTRSETRCAVEGHSEVRANRAGRRATRTCSGSGFERHPYGATAIGTPEPGCDQGKRCENGNEWR
jgi:aminoglycoside phosphotransferase (APT) family kinase protein